MNKNERLQKAIETTNNEGYQLSNDAFDYLSNNCEEIDPLAIMNMVLHEIRNLKEKPFFIEKKILENMVKQLTQTRQTAQATQNEKKTNSNQTTKNIENNTQQTSSKTLDRVNYKEDNYENEFYPYAKYIPSELKVLEDSTDKLTSNGTLEEYTTLFQDRFKRIEKILRQRIDVRAATPIKEAVKSQPKTKLKIICMLTEKRSSKQQTILTVEDLGGSTIVLVPNKAPEEVKKKALQILPDQVICLAVTKTNKTNLFLAEDIIFPDVGHKTLQKAQEQVYAVLTSDIHIGSTKFNKKAFKKFILWLKGKYGTPEMKKIAGYVKYLIIAGDIVDGVGVYPGQQHELTIRDIHKQYNHAIKYIEKIPEYIEIILTPGNHDTSRKALPQPAIPPHYITAIKDKTNIHSLGSPCLINIHGINILIDHGRSLDDIISAVPEMSHQHPEKSMRLLLQGRHIAPVYGGRTMLSPENRDYLVIDKVPDILHTGHVHVLGYCNYRGVIAINSGTWQEQTSYMEKLGLIPTTGKVPIINLMTMEITILDFKTEN